MGTILLRSLLPLLVLSCLYPLQAQKRSFYKGYIIQQQGDTIYGHLKDRSPEPYVTLFAKVRFKQDGRSRTRKYGPDAILGYGYGNQHFVSLPFREESTFFKFRYYSDASAPRVFLKVIRRSRELVYFEQEFVHDDNFYLDRIPFFYRPQSGQVVRVTQGLLGFKRKQLAAFFTDCPELTTELYSRNRSFQSVSELYAFCLEQCMR